MGECKHQANHLSPFKLLKQLNDSMKELSPYELISFNKHRFGGTIGKNQKPAIISVLSHQIGVTEGPQPLISILSHRVGNSIDDDSNSLLSVLSHKTGDRNQRGKSLIEILSHRVG